MALSTRSSSFDKLRMRSSRGRKAAGVDETGETFLRSSEVIAKSKPKG